MQAPRTRVQRRPGHGVLLLDKPLGLSSNDALQKAKWLLRAEKAGHTGTLDPLATGLLPLCFGAATKFSQVSLDADKRYTATLRSIEPAPDSILTDTTTSTSTSSTTSTAIYYNGLFDAPNPDGKLRISMTAQVQIVRADAPGALTIPATALGPRGKDGSYTVRVVGTDGQAQPRQVKVGLNNNVSAQVLEGLSEGDKVVIGDAASAPSKNGQQGGMRPPMRL